MTGEDRCGLPAVDFAGGATGFPENEIEPGRQVASLLIPTIPKQIALGSYRCTGGQNALASAGLIEDIAIGSMVISGQIVKPGKYDLREAKTLMQAVFLAGGFTRDGNKKMVIHARPDGRGEWRIQAANVMGILNQKGTQKDIELRSGDYIYVPESRIAKFSRAVDIVRPFLPRF